MPLVTIDGEKLEFKPGETIITVAAKHNSEIPHYCWHKRLSVAANCRMCLVEVEGAPKLLPGCQTECKDGMVVHTKSEKVRAAQRAVHEFLLINHPIDCPICDQAGECKLQDYYMKLQLAPSRMHDAKVRKHKREHLGPYVVYDAERCIVCTRCVRFMEEVAGERQLGVFNRGDHAVIGTFPGLVLDNPYSLNTVDVCPVGALTSSVFRFKQRVWNLRRAASLCPGCARGCNVWVDHREGQVYRLLPRENEAVNKSWLCDEGRLTYRRANDARLVTGLERAPAAAASASSSASPSVIEVLPGAALARAIELLRPRVAAGKRTAVALSLHATCEQAYLFGRLAKEALKAELVGILEYPPGGADSLLRVADKNPNRTGVLRVLHDLELAPMPAAELARELTSGRVEAVVVAGHETASAAELARAFGGLEVFVHLAHARGPLAEHAHVTIPSLPWVQTEGTWINTDDRAQRLTPGFAAQGGARPLEGWLLEMLGAFGITALPPSLEALRVTMARELPSFAAWSGHAATRVTGAAAAKADGAADSEGHAA